jgi:hypothetical protein
MTGENASAEKISLQEHGPAGQAYVAGGSKPIAAAGKVL